MQESQGVSGAVFNILGKTATAIEPGEGAFDNPSTGQDDEPLGSIRALDDFDLDLREDPSDGLFEDRPLIAAVGEQLAQERVKAKQGRNKQDAAVDKGAVGVLVVS